MATPKNTPAIKPGDLLADAIRVVSRNALALCATVDASGVPHARWMGVIAMDGLKRVYTLSGRNARKLEHLRLNPSVCWVFSSDDRSDVVTLYGRARIVIDPAAVQVAWERLAESAQAYAMSVVSGEDLELVTIETVVEKAEILSPRLGIFAPMEVGLQA